MSKLPNLDEVKARLKALASKPKEVKQPYALDNIHVSTRIKGDFKPCHLEALQELLHPCLWNNAVKTAEYWNGERFTAPITFYSKIFKNLNIGWHFIYKSFTVSLYDEFGVLKTLIVRYSVNKDGTLVKWRTYGSKTFIPHKINNNDSVVFVASGIGEYILLELMGVSYITPQSDSTVSGIATDMIEACSGKTIFYLQDNDDSGRKLGAKLKEIFSNSVFIVVDFEFVLDRYLPHGYDFRDFCNEMAVRYGDDVWAVIKDMLSIEMRYKMEAIKCLKS